MQDDPKTDVAEVEKPEGEATPVVENGDQGESGEGNDAPKAPEAE
jgi:hypothetical protein